VDTCDALIVGGGPAGSACAWRLGRAGLDVIVMDRATFPRDKVCAGWITPPVVADLALDVEHYRQARTFQPFTGFRTGIIGEHEEVETSYGHAVSFGIRRCEFDDYLLRRSDARLALGAPIESIRRDGARWTINDRVKAAVLVAAGGHFCPVARWLNGPPSRDAQASVVVAQEAELAIEPADADAFTTAPGVPELYFCGDLKGYGWCIRKQQHLNVGFGRLDHRSLPRGTAEFVAFLKATRKIPADVSWRWRGHAYAVNDSTDRRVVDAGVLVVGDAAGLAYPLSGEGIRPAIESGLLAALTIIEAAGRYSRDRLEPYEQRLRARFGVSPVARTLSRILPAGLEKLLVRELLGTPRFVRHVVLDRWFLHAHEPALAAC
jgi:flavin-dependent dehydrogenase